MPETGPAATDEELRAGPGYHALARHIEMLDARIVRIHQNYARRLQRLQDQLAVRTRERDAVDALVRDLAMDWADRCDHPDDCSCSMGRAIRYSREREGGR